MKTYLAVQYFTYFTKKVLNFHTNCHQNKARKYSNEVFLFNRRSRNIRYSTIISCLYSDKRDIYSHKRGIAQTFISPITIVIYSCYFIHLNNFTNAKA